LSHKSVTREAAAFLFYLALAVVLTWPLVPELTTAVSDPGDPLINTWILDWVCHALTHDPLSVYDAPIFHPGIKPLAYSENLIAVAVLVLPFHLAGVPPVGVYNIAMLLGFALAGYGAFVLARMVARNTVAALTGGIFFAFCAYKFDHLAHLQIVFSAWVPLTLAALLAFWQRATWKRAAALALVLLLGGLTNIYLLMFAGVATLFTIALLATIEPRDKRFFARLALAFVVGAALLYPFLSPYRQVSKHYKLVRLSEEVNNFSAKWSDWVVPSGTSLLYGRLADPERGRPERFLFPGMAILFFAVWGAVGVRRSGAGADAGGLKPAAPPGRVWDVLLVVLLLLAWAGAVSERFVLAVAGRQLLSVDSSDVPLMTAISVALIRFRRPLREAAARSRFNSGAWAAAVWIVVGVLGSLGLQTFLYTFFYRRFEPFQAMRVPPRFAVIAYAGLAVWGAIGVAAILGRMKRKALASVLLLAVAIADVWPRFRWEHVPAEVPPVYRWLAKERVGPIVEVPVWGNGVEYFYMLGAATHRVPTVNGISGFAPAETWQARDAEQRGAYDELLALAEQWGVRLIVVHGDALNGEKHARIADFVRRNIAAKRIGFVRRFDAEATGDYVFAVTKNLPHWPLLRAAEVPDGAGNLPDQTLERFLSGKTTHNDAIVIRIEEPQPWARVQDTLRVQGWTVSPHGILRAAVLVDGERFEAQLVERTDVKAAYPWLYFVEKPGFTVTLPKRARGDVYIVVEVVDQAGRKRRSREVPVRWE
jgi:hypothetical protein